MKRLSLAIVRDNDMISTTTQDFATLDDFLEVANDWADRAADLGGVLHVDREWVELYLSSFVRDSQNRDKHLDIGMPLGYPSAR